MIKTLMLAAAMTGLFGADAAAAPKPKGQVLKSGEYSATAKALVCSACAAEVEKALKGRSEIESASVTAETAAVRFKIKKGASLKLGDLQLSLKAAADKMGMGADYALINLKRASVASSTSDKRAVPSAPATEQATYACPMHPEVVSGKPGTCLQCGMALQRK